MSPFTTKFKASLSLQDKIWHQFVRLSGNRLANKVYETKFLSSLVLLPQKQMR